VRRRDDRDAHDQRLPDRNDRHPAGERQLWRILNASAHRHFDLALFNNQYRFARAWSWSLRTVFHWAITGARRSWNRYPCADSAGRAAEVIVTGTKQISYLDTLCYDAGTNGDINPFGLLAELIDDRAPHRRGGRAADRPAATGVYRTAPRPAEQRLIRFGEDANGFYLNKTAYRPNDAPMIVARAGTTEEWTLENDTDEVHTFHIHQVHFIVEA